MARERLRRILFPWSHESLLFEVTARCNLACRHCYNVWKNDATPAAPAELSTDRMLALIGKAVRESRCRIATFTGGEPLLRDDLEALVARAAARCDQVNLITNGMLLTEGRVRSLLAAGVTLFELPLNSADRDTHNRMAGSAEAFDAVTRAAAEIRSQGGELAFVFVGTKHNIAQWRDAAELGMALGARNFLFNRYNAGGECRGKPEDLLPSVEQVRAGLEAAEELARDHGIGIGVSIPVPPCLIDPKDFPHLGFGFCAAGTTRAYYTIDPVGNVRPCNHTPRVLGNLFETSLRDLARSPEMAAFMNARPAFCQGCRLENECLGGCKAAAEVCQGSLNACDPFLELNRERAARPG